VIPFRDASVPAPSSGAQSIIQTSLVKKRTAAIFILQSSFFVRHARTFGVFYCLPFSLVQFNSNPFLRSITMRLKSLSNIPVFAGLLLLFTLTARAQTDIPLPRPEVGRIAATCEACHGNRGQGSGEFPAISSLTDSVFIQKMADFKSDKTTATVMNRIAKGYQDTDFVNLARFFSRSGGIR